MVTILALDASTYVGSVALVRDGAVVAGETAAMRGEREERLMPAVAALLREHGVSVDEVDAVACGSGPGSFTSLRIAAAIAKGLCAARDIPLLVAPSTLLLVAAAEPALPLGAYVAALDAMRGDYFCQDVDVVEGHRLVPGPSFRAGRADRDAHASARGARIAGPGELVDVAPHARGFARLLAGGLAKPVELTSWEPDYGRKAEAQVRWEAAHGRPLEAT